LQGEPRRGGEHRRLLEQALSRDPDDARLRYYLGESLLRDGQTAEAAACFKTCLQMPQRLPRPLVVDAFSNWLEALIALGDARSIDRVARRGELAQALSPAAREMLADFNARRGRLTEARRQLALALNPNASPFGLVRPEGVGGWRTRLHLALVEERSGLLDGALDNLSQAFGDVPTEHRFSVAVLATRFAARQDANLAREWLERTLDCAPKDLDAELSILELRLTIPALIEFHSNDESLVAVDRALVQQEWQAAYDLAMRSQLHELAALARVLYLANCLRERGAADAALDLLDRAIDVHPRTRAVYWLLTSVLIDLDRYDDAHVAVEVLQLLRREEQSSTPALAA
jgi:tetratricopeptide (TPR) repeat protein